MGTGEWRILSPSVRPVCPPRLEMDEFWAGLGLGRKQGVAVCKRFDAALEQHGHGLKIVKIESLSGAQKHKV